MGKVIPLSPKQSYSHNLAKIAIGTICAATLLYGVSKTAPMYEHMLACIRSAMPTSTSPNQPVCSSYRRFGPSTYITKK